MLVVCAKADVATSVHKTAAIDVTFTTRNVSLAMSLYARGIAFSAVLSKSMDSGHLSDHALSIYIR
jgi:hypothetical protein